MKIMTVSRFVLRSAVVVTTAACGRSDAPKTPLGAARAGNVGANESAAPAIIGEAKLALDSGNMLFRAKAYDHALAQYRRSAVLAPHEIAPLLGILMVADVTKDSRLGDATLPLVRKLNPAVADSSASTPHSRMIEAHPRTIAPRPP